MNGSMPLKFAPTDTAANEKPNSENGDDDVNNGHVRSPTVSPVDAAWLLRVISSNLGFRDVRNQCAMRLSSFVVLRGNLSR